MDFCFIVVLYGSELSQSETWCSLIKNINIINALDYMIVVHNNGPHNLILTPDLADVNFIIHEDISNIGLSSIYNKYISMYDSHYYVVLDQDTRLTSSYLNLLIEEKFCNSDLVIPIILDGGVKKYPKVKGEILAEGIYSNKLKIASISSGLIISRNLINAMISNFGDAFDERFLFYGVDSAFFLRLRKLKKVLKIKCKSELSHSLSLFEGEISYFKKCETIYDLALQMRYYPRLSIFINFFRVVYKNVFHFNFIRMILFTFLSGKHPRSK